MASARLLVVARREYRETVRRRAFLVLTVLTPLLFSALVFLPQMLATRALGGTKNVLVLDGTGQLTNLPDLAREMAGDEQRELATMFAISVRPSADPAAEAEREIEQVRSKDIDVLLVVPAAVLAKDAATYYSRTATDVLVRQVLGSALNRAVTLARARQLGVPVDKSVELVQRVEVRSEQVLREGATKSRGRLDFMLAFAFALLLMMPTIFHGQEIMRGVIQEKTDRVVESLISSMDAFDLLTGKVIGMAAVGLTQIAIWLAMGGLALPLGGGFLAAVGVNPLGLFTPIKALYFVLFYLLGYLTYACAYAMIGAAVNSEKEAQQAATPLLLVLMIPWMVLFAIVSDPESTFSVTMSLIPCFVPITMFIRIVVGDPPVWQIALSVLSAGLGILGLFWMAARIFRVGILWYGKRPSLPEFLRWLRQA